jgi:2-polyprenyl-6-methoxyphenol hydroxylase-like FAD-dependent oxidoreductase
MRYNLRLTRIEERDNIVTAHFANNESLTADLLIGCDGIHSVTRSYVVGEDIKPSFAGVSVIIGLTKITEEEAEAAGITRGFHFWLGHRTAFGCFPCSPDGIWAW